MSAHDAQRRRVIQHRALLIRQLASEGFTIESWSDENHTVTLTHPAFDPDRDPVAKVLINPYAAEVSLRLTLPLPSPSSAPHVASDVARLLRARFPALNDGHLANFDLAIATHRTHEIHSPDYSQQLLVNLSSSLTLLEVTYTERLSPE